ncbi:MAG: hypothetical protein ACLPXT_13265 [Terracidiphilus sp.]
MTDVAELPEAPQAQQTPAAGQSQATPPTAPQAAPAPTGATQGGSSSQAPPQQPGTEQSLHDQAGEQLKAEEKQRVWGVMATFNTTRIKDALPLSPGQKFQLSFRSIIDPWAFTLSATVAGIAQAHGSEPEWGQGMQGYAKKFGAGYTDYSMGNFFGNALLPSLLHEDPRYYQKGSGPVVTRVLWAAASGVWCKRDKGGWGPSYGNIIGNLIGSSIARSYYPASERTVGDTIRDGMTVTYEGIIGPEVIEFWPDLVRHHRRKQAEKAARKAARSADSAH